MSRGSYCPQKMISVHGTGKDTPKPEMPQLNLEFFTKDLSYLSSSSKVGVSGASDKVNYTDLQKQMRRLLRDMKRVMTRSRATTDALVDMSESVGENDIEEEISEEQTEFDYSNVIDDATLQMAVISADDELSGTIQHMTETLDNINLNDSDDEEQAIQLDDDQCIMTPSMATPTVMLCADKESLYLDVLRKNGYNC